MQRASLIGGRLLPGTGPEEPILDAATGAEIARVPEAAAAQLDAAVAPAEAAFEGWRGTPPKERAAALLRIADHIEADAADYADLESRNTGKPLTAL